MYTDNMDLLINILFLFVYLIVLFYFGMPDITNNNYLMHKALLFATISAFNYVFYLIKKMKEGNKINYKKILANSIYYGLFGVVGYSIYIDLMYMNFSVGMNIESDNVRFVICSLIISLFTLLMRSGLYILGF
jgi:hypothetical protein